VRVTWRRSWRLQERSEVLRSCCVAQRYVHQSVSHWTCPQDPSPCCTWPSGSTFTVTHYTMSTFPQVLHSINSSVPIHWTAFTDLDCSTVFSQTWLRRLNYIKTVFGQNSAPDGRGVVPAENGFNVRELRYQRAHASSRYLRAPRFHLLNWYPHFLDQSHAPALPHI